MKKLILLTSLLLLTFCVLACSSGLYKGSPKRGTVADGVYTNDYFKLSFTIPEGWNAYTDAEVFEKSGISWLTDEDLINKKMGFGDVWFYKTHEQKDRIIVYYSITENEKDLTDEQIKNRLSSQKTGFEFGDIEYLKIGEADYAMIYGPSSDGTLNYYYIWNKEVCGYLRPIINMQLDSADSANDILKNFTQTISVD